jgi:hypothetical protein
MYAGLQVPSAAFVCSERGNAGISRHTARKPRATRTKSTKAAARKPAVPALPVALKAMPCSCISYGDLRFFPIPIMLRSHTVADGAVSIYGAHTIYRTWIPRNARENVLPIMDSKYVWLQGIRARTKRSLEVQSPILCAAVIRVYVKILNVYVPFHNILHFTCLKFHAIQCTVADDCSYMLS